MTLRKLKSLIKHTGVKLVKDNKTMVYTVTLPNGCRRSSKGLLAIFEFVRKTRFYWNKKKMLGAFGRYNCNTFIRVVMAIYNEQTENEKMSGLTIEHNDRGFDSYDAPYFKRIVNYQRAHGYISRIDILRCKGRMTKYHKQLCVLAMVRHRALVMPKPVEVWVQMDFFKTQMEVA